MTIKELKNILSYLPEETIVLIEQDDVLDAKTVEVQHHSDGSTHIIFSCVE